MTKVILEYRLEIHKFLLALSESPQPAGLSHLPVGSRPQDKARQWCRKNGYALHVHKHAGDNPNPARSGWIITEKGRRFLKELETE